MSSFFQCNYQTQIFHVNGLSTNAPDVFPNHFATRAGSNIQSLNYNSAGITTQSQAYQILLNDFQKIREIGFNTVRIGITYGQPYTSFPPWLDTKGGQLPYGPLTNYPAIGSFNMGTDDYAVDYRYIDISNNTKLLLDIIDNVIQAAKSMDLKVILLTGEPSSVVPWYCDNCQQSVIDGYTNFLAELATRFKYNSTLMAIDFGNEPDYQNKKYNFFKTDVCSITKNWNDAVKGHSQILTTIGLSDFESTNTWDPDMSNIDFVSIHPYPGVKDTNNLSDLSNAIESMKSRYFWYNKYLRIPWMVGETAISAHPMNTNHPINNGNRWDASKMTRGTLTDQSVYLENTLNSCRDFGGAGYSWWAFMDNGGKNYNVVEGGDYWGVAYTSNPNQQVVWKPSANKITTFNPSLIGNSTMPSNYFNLLNTSQNNVILGKVIDQYNQPVKGALLIGKDFDGIKLGTTFTDDEGYFTLYSNYQVNVLHVSAFGLSFVTLSPSQTFNNITLQRLVTRPLIQQSKIFQSQNLYNANITEYVSKNADFSSSYNLYSGIQNITAGEVIHLNNGFSAKYGCNFNARIGKYYDNCASFSYRGEEVQSEINEIPSEMNFNIFPNPGNGKYLFTSKNENNYQIKVFTIQGKLINTIVFNGKQFEINIENLNPGIYFFNIYENDSPSKTIKIIKE